MSVGPDIQSLFADFPPTSYLCNYEMIPAEHIPQPYRDLLVHQHHMTVTVEAHHGSLVDVRVLDRKRCGDSYARKILLALQSNGKIVQFGLVRIWLNYCSPDVAERIVSESTPLGRILIEHDVMRRIEPTEYVRVTPGPDMMTWFGLTMAVPAYGRLAIIHCDGKPAIELLEIVTPE